ncbi:hypothetical protein BWI17_10725 [Betaproteobacteria bacterium GR16-43]|nr:hypothetical protein BWI17_10725 [Betaproteobacteria bacterium GR16-43]
MKRFLPHSVAVRLGLSYALLVGLLLLVASTGLLRLDALNREFSSIVVDRHSRTERLKQVTDAQHQLMRMVNRVLLVEDRTQVAADLARIEAAKTSIGENLEQLDKTFSGEDPRGKGLLRDAHERNGVYLVNLVRFTRMVGADRRAEARAILAELDPQLDAAAEAMATLASAQTALMHRSQQEAQESFEAARGEALGISLAAVIAALLVAVGIARSITRPLGAAVQLAGAVAAGDLRHKPAAEGSDETARLLQALGRMTGSLTGIVSGVRAASENIAVTAREMVAGNSQLTQRAEAQASALEQTAASLEELTATVKRNSERATEASRLASNTSQMAVRAGDTVNQAVERMDAMAAASGKISEITQVINGLSFQTNILALNAAVEAAHAGDQGRGFAVVASEVRILAQRSATAAREIGELIAAAVAEVQSGAKLVNEAGRTMADVVDGIQGVTRQVSEISGASQEQSSAIEQVNSALAEIEQGTQGNVAVAEENAAAVESLEEQSRALLGTVDVFRLGEATPEPGPARSPLPQKQTARSPAPLSPAWPTLTAAGRSAVPRY